MSPEPSFDLNGLGRRACRDLENVFEQVDPTQLEQLSRELLGADRIICYGVGREALMMGAIAMRLMHAGFKSYVVGEMVTPPVRAGDVFFTSAGPGHFPTVETLLKVAREAGGRPVIVTAQPARAAQMRSPDRVRDEVASPTRARGADARGRRDPPARPDHGGRDGRLERLNHGHPLRGCLVVIWRFTDPAPSGADLPKARRHAHPVHQHEVKALL